MLLSDRLNSDLLRGGPVDGVDSKVIGCLLRNARATLAEIGAEVGLSAPAVKRRIDRLVASGAIQGFTALIDPDVLGWQTEAYVELYCKGTVSPEDLRRSWSRPGTPSSARTSAATGSRPSRRRPPTTRPTRSGRWRRTWPT
jgi:hypothetical protein